MADPGFPVGGGGRRGPPTRALFSENVCEKELGPMGGRVPGTPPRSANEGLVVLDKRGVF